ncbi:hypothetical protein CIK02_13750 [Pseudomonas putida]|nr:hypothetical protein CIK02_13750 [Pseudomonas putida]
MLRNRFTMAQEGVLWKAALEHLGPQRLLETVVDLLRSFGPRPARSQKEYLERQWLGEDILRIVKSAQVEAGIEAPGPDDLPNRVTILACYSDYLADRLLLLVPADVLPRELVGRRIDDDLGV